MKVKMALSRRQILWIGISFCFVMAIMLLQVEELLARRLSELKKEYYLGLVLSEQRDERTRTYAAVLKTAKLPQQSKMDQNEWIQKTQTLVTSNQLSLEELLPGQTQDNSGRKRAEIDLIFEGKMRDVLSFLKAVSESEDYVYARHFLISSGSDKSESIRVEMTLAQ